MHAIPAQRLLTHEARQAGVKFLMGDSRREIPSLLIFSAAWAMPLVSTYAKALALAAFGRGSAVLIEAQRVASDLAPLGYESHVLPMDGSPAGLLRAALLTRAAQEALGYRLNAPQIQPVDWVALVNRARHDRDCLPARLLAADEAGESALMDVVREGLIVPPADLSGAVFAERDVVPAG